MNVIWFLPRLPFPLIISEEKCCYLLRKNIKTKQNTKKKKEKKTPKFLKGVDVCEDKVIAPQIVDCTVFAAKFDWRLNGGKYWVFFSYSLAPTMLSFGRTQ